MTLDAAGETRVTVVMCARERHALAETAIDSIVRHTRAPFRFVYLDVASPAWLREVLARRVQDWGLEVVRCDGTWWPQQARASIAGRIDTEYVVFIDNDVQVEPGWLDALVACADQTGAGVVGPLYLWGDGVRAPTIHMAGGHLAEIEVDGGRVLAERHLHFDADPDRVAGQLVRSTSDYAEFHCMLVRTALVRDRHILDPTIRCVHEHIDICRSATRQGFPVYLEPAARVTYLAFAPYLLDDLAFFRSRWSTAEADASIGAFCAKWDVIDDARSFGGVRNFVREHAAEVDPLREPHAPRADQRMPMQRADLHQTRSELLDLAVARGYREDEIALISDSWHVAQILMDGGYRPCGRPFINHVTGTACVLVRYGFRVELVAAALLHAAYTHCPPHPGGKQAAATAMHELLGGDHSPVNLRVRAYTLRDASERTTSAHASSPAGLSVLDAEILALVAANEVDMLLSGEVRYSGRIDALPEATVAAIAQVCRLLGAEGLFETLELARREVAAVAPRFVTRVSASYRLSTDRRSTIPMVNNVLAGINGHGG